VSAWGTSHSINRRPSAFANFGLLRHAPFHLRTKTATLASAAALAFYVAPLAHAQEEIALSIALKDHRFVPAEPDRANRPITIVAGNQDPTPSE
jgi:hypothetical protein